MRSCKPCTTYLRVSIIFLHCFRKTTLRIFFLDHNDVGENNTGIRYDNVLGEKTDVLWIINYVKSQRVKRYEHATKWENTEIIKAKINLKIQMGRDQEAGLRCRGRIK